MVDYKRGRTGSRSSTVPAKEGNNTYRKRRTLRLSPTPSPTLGQVTKGVDGRKKKVTVACSSWRVWCCWRKTLEEEKRTRETRENDVATSKKQRWTANWKAFPFSNIQWSQGGPEPSVTKSGVRSSLMLSLGAGPWSIFWLLGIGCLETLAKGTSSRL